MRRRRPFGLRRQVFWSLVGSMLTAGVVTLGFAWLWSGWTVWGVGLAVMVALWVASGRLARRIVRPLQRLVDVVQRFGQGDLSARTGVPGRSRDEVARVARAIDEMAGRIERQVKEERALLAVVSHELRTPMARIRVLTDLAREGRSLDTSLDDIDREVAEVDYLVANLLARSRLEFGNLARRGVRLSDAVSEALGRAGLEPGLLRIEGEEASVWVDPTLLHRAIANLLDNAVRHGGGVARVAVRWTEEGGEMEVFDEGPGFAAQETAVRFQAFSRSGGTGLGLGLSLVHRIVVAHGGRAWAENRPEGGARVGFTIPYGNEALQP